MTPKIGDILRGNLSITYLTVAPIIVIQAIPEKDVYILQNQITGQREQYTSAQLDIYFHYINWKQRAR